MLNVKNAIIGLLIAVIAAGGAIAAFAANPAGNSTNVEVTVWQRVSDGAIFLSTRSEGGEWTTRNTAIDLSKMSESGLYRQSSPVTVTVADGAPAKGNAQAYAVWLVDQALARYERDGLQATLDYYNSPAALDGPWYVFMIEDRDGALYSVANSNVPEIVGTTRERIDRTGFNYGEAFAETVDGGAGQWVVYWFTHPETREDAEKHTWIVRVGDYLFGAGWYEGISSE